MSGTKFQSFDTLAYETEGSTDTWPTWEAQCKSALVLSNLWGYIHGRGVATPPETILDTSTPPVPITNPKYEDWLDENLIVLSCIRLRIGTTDLRLIKDEIIAKKAWEMLKAAHQPSGALSQLTILQQALACRYSRDTPLAQTTDKLDVLIDSFFAIKPPTEDEWRCIIYLNAMTAAEFKDARSSLDTLLSAGTLSSAAVSARIKHEQVRIDAENAEAAKNEASFAAFTKQYEAQGASAKSSPNGQGPCANPQCKGWAKQHHDWDHCYGPGGRIKPPKGKARKGGVRKEKAKIAVESSEESDEQAAFAEDSSGYRSFFADADSSHANVPADRDTTSVDWSRNTTDHALAALIKAIILYLDTGATSSICPFLKYFTKITPCNRTISGVGGSSIKAIGIGEVRVRIGKGRHFILKDVLYCPRAAITLISVGKLCDDGHKATFSDKGCSIKRLSGKVIATGTRSEAGLYTLDCETPIFSLADRASETSFDAMANIAIKARPTLKTLHLRLGHVNIETVLDMARGSAVTEKEARSQET